MGSDCVSSCRSFLLLFCSNASIHKYLLTCWGQLNVIESICGPSFNTRTLQLAWTITFAGPTPKPKQFIYFFFPFFWHLLLIISVFLADFLVGTEVLAVEVGVKIFGGSLQVEVVS